MKTGDTNLDILMGGGVNCGSITEFCGDADTGKTQFCCNLAILCQIPRDEEKKIKGGKCIFIDTKRELRTDYLKKVVIEHQLDVKETLNNIQYCGVYNTDH